MYAFCWRSGQIEFGARIPDGALPIIHGRAKIVKEIVGARARHAYDGRTLLVPGIPEAATELAAFEALKRFQHFCRSGASRRLDEAKRNSVARLLKEVL